MPEVYIDSLQLDNFGPFYGEHTLNFGSLEGRCGIVVGGKNGAGKTHLLRALFTAVVGESDAGQRDIGDASQRSLWSFKCPPVL